MKASRWTSYIYPTKPTFEPSGLRARLGGKNSAEATMVLSLLPVPISPSLEVVFLRAET